MNRHLSKFLAASMMVFLLAGKAFPQGSETNGALDVSSVSQSLNKAIKKLQDDQRFQELRDERIQLLEKIPERRARIQALVASSDELDATIQTLQGRLSTAKSGFETEALIELRVQRARMDGAQQSELLLADNLKTRKADTLKNLSAKRQEGQALKTKLAKIRETVASAQLEVIEAAAAIRKLTSGIDGKRVSLEGEIALLEKEFEYYKDAQIFERLSEKRRELVAVEAETHSSELADAKNKIDVLETHFQQKKNEEQRLSGDLKSLTLDAEDIDTERLNIEIEEARNAKSLIEIQIEIERLNNAIERQAKVDAQRVDSPASLQSQLEQTEAKRKELSETLENERSLLQAEILRQTTVENEINDLFIPRSAENSFKLWMSFAFALLVGLVIWKFFQITRDDASVRRVVFSAEAGIQFVTLFSLVIAIILFGITGILEGKELSALLGGISGYILGRSTPALANQTENTSATTAPSEGSTPPT